jgi:hypothetical protein
MRINPETASKKPITSRRDVRYCRRFGQLQLGLLGHMSNRSQMRLKQSPRPPAWMGGTG